MSGGTGGARVRPRRVGVGIVAAEAPDALAETLRRGQAVYWSRSRARLWHKGEESGHFQEVHEVRMDCDNDVLLLQVTQHGHEPGIACHTGRHSCFYQRLEGGTWRAVEPVLEDPDRIYRR